MKEFGRKIIVNKYKYVYKVGNNFGGFGISWLARITGVYQSTHKTEREAALAIDKYLISIGKEPVNILKRK